MNLLRDVPIKDDSGNYHVVVEVPRGSGLKLKYQPESGGFVWSRALRYGLVYPHDYGFIPKTKADDGEAVDCMVLAEVGSYPGVIIPVRLIGALRMTQQRGTGEKRNDRVIAIPVNEHRLSHIQELMDLPQRAREEIQAFFESSLTLTGKTVEFEGWADAAEARSHVEAAAKRLG